MKDTDMSEIGEKIMPDIKGAEIKDEEAAVRVSEKV